MLVLQRSFPMLGCLIICLLSMYFAVEGDYLNGLELVVSQCLGQIRIFAEFFCSVLLFVLSFINLFRLGLRLLLLYSLLGSFFDCFNPYAFLITRALHLPSSAKHQFQMYYHLKEEVGSQDSDP